VGVGAAAARARTRPNTLKVHHSPLSAVETCFFFFPVSATFMEMLKAFGIYGLRCRETE